MAEMYQLDYGYEVKILEGKHKGKTGFVVMGSTHGDVGINIRKMPQIGSYQIREHPSKIEIISMENPHKLKFGTRDLSMFQYERFMIRIDKPQIVLDNPQYFEQYHIDAVKKKS